MHQKIIQNCCLLEKYVFELYCIFTVYCAMQLHCTIFGGTKVLICQTGFYMAFYCMVPTVTNWFELHCQKKCERLQICCILWQLVSSPSPKGGKKHFKHWLQWTVTNCDKFDKWWWPKIKLWQIVTISTNDGDPTLNCDKLWQLWQVMVTQN